VVARAEPARQPQAPVERSSSIEAGRSDAPAPPAPTPVRPAAKPVQRAAAPAPKVEPKPAAQTAPAPAPKAKPKPQRAVTSAGVPDLLVAQTSWHPTASRRSATVRVDSGAPLEVQEGDAVGRLVVSRIEPSSVVFLLEGLEIRRKVGQR
jgi:hypothetical protein